jgi:hypothetical protein
MARVECEIDGVELDGERSPVEGVEATCTRCGHQAQSYGTGPASVRRCLVLLREECPRGERNFYAAPDGEDED